VLNMLYCAHLTMVGLLKNLCMKDWV